MRRGLVDLCAVRIAVDFRSGEAAEERSRFALCPDALRESYAQKVEASVADSTDAVKAQKEAQLEALAAALGFVSTFAARALPSCFGTT